jgi:hypothetical protein
MDRRRFIGTLAVWPSRFARSVAAFMTWLSDESFLVVRGSRAAHHANLIY